ncbi:MAG: phage portal protein [Pelagibacteraceae bacterium]
MALWDFLRRDKIDLVADKPKTKRRTYAAARGGRLFSDFISSGNSADSELRYSLELMRNRSRELVRDNEFARRYMNLLKTNVVGEQGFQLQLKARNSDGSLDSAGNTIIENAWRRWGRLGSPTADGRMSWLDCQRFVIESMARDGEVFVKKLRGSKYKDGFGLQFLEAELIDEKKNETLQNGNEIRMGIEMDRAHRPVAYHVLTSHPGDKYYYSTPADNRTRVPAEEMLHIYMPTRTYQTRGEPFMVSAMSAMKHLQAYREAEVIAARIAASKMGILTSPGGEEYVGDDNSQDYMPVIDVEPGTFHQLPSGYSMDMFDPKHPTTGFGEFESAMLRGVASGLNVSYAALSSDLSSVNYSSIRQGALDERDSYRSLQMFLIQHLVEPIFREWLMSAMDFGAIPIPSSKFEKFSDNTHFRGRGWNWVDPLKEMNAAVVGLNNGILSMQDVAAHYGRDAEETFNQISRDKELAAQFGLKMAFEPFGQKSPAAAEVTSADDGTV